MLSYQEVAERFNVCRRTIERWLSLGAFPKPIRIAGSFPRWRASVIEAFIARQEAEAQRTA
jgi:predicted DNA-binding transcriptional regulator AlpA